MDVPREGWTRHNRHGLPDTARQTPHMPGEAPGGIRCFAKLPRLNQVRRRRLPGSGGSMEERAEKGGVLKVGAMAASVQKRLATIKGDALLLEAARLLGNPLFNLVIVCAEGGKVAGVITKTDVVSHISHCMGANCRMAASDAMTRNIASCQLDDPLDHAWAVMKQRGVRTLPVIDKALSPVGVLNARDALQVLLENAEHEEQLLRDYVTCTGYH